MGQYGVAIVALIGYSTYGLIVSIKKHPDIIDKAVQEKMIRKIIFRKHNLICLILYVLGTVGIGLIGDKSEKNK